MLCGHERSSVQPAVEHVPGNTRRSPPPGDAISPDTKKEAKKNPNATKQLGVYALTPTMAMAPCLFCSIKTIECNVLIK